MKTATRYQILAVIAALIMCMITGAAKAGEEEASAQLFAQRPENVLSVSFIPTESEGKTVYYVPDEGMQKTLIGLIQNIQDKEEMTDHVGEWPKEYRDAAEWNVYVWYGEYHIEVRGDGFMRVWHQPEPYSSGREWLARDTEIMDCVMNLLKEEAGFEPFDIGRIRDIVKIELQDGKFYGGTPHEPVVITDSRQLAEIEKLLAAAEPTYASGCPFGLCRLALTTAEGDEIILIPALDSCTVFYADGIYFDYQPAETRGSEDHETNEILFDLLGVSAEQYQKTNEAYYGR